MSTKLANTQAFHLFGIPANQLLAIPMSTSCVPFH